MSKFFSIQETAAMFGLSAPTLRYYDSEGLLPGIERAPGGARLFTPETIRALRVIGCLKNSGLSIRQIQKFFEMTAEGDTTIPERRALFVAQRDAVLEEIDALKNTLEILDYKCWYYKMAEELESEESVKALSDEDVPVELRSARARLEAEPNAAPPT